MSSAVEVGLQNTVNAVLLGAMYGLIAMGFSLVWGVLNVVNLAHGALVMLGAYLSYWLFTQYHVDPLVALPATAAVLFFFGYLLQRLVINQVVRASFLVTFLLTFGLELVITNLALAAWTPDVRAVTTSYSGSSLAVGPVTLPVVRGMGLAIALLVAALLHAIMTRTV